MFHLVLLTLTLRNRGISSAAQSGFFVRMAILFAIWELLVPLRQKKEMLSFRFGLATGPLALLVAAYNLPKTAPTWGGKVLEDSF